MTNSIQNDPQNPVEVQTVVVRLLHQSLGETKTGEKKRAGTQEHEREGHVGVARQHRSQRGEERSQKRSEERLWKSKKNKQGYFNFPN